MKWFGALLFTLAVVPQCWGQNALQHPEWDTSGKGAILCVHYLVAAAKSYAEACHTENADQLKALDTALQRFEQFEMDHGGWSKKDAERFTENALHEHSLVSRPDLCALNEQDMAELYVGLYERFGGPNSAAAVDEILSIPRKPVMNPCL